ncbi:MAG: hypothetical protein ABWX94_02375 [Candidatus Saccharimonadales bacterium]
MGTEIISSETQGPKVEISGVLSYEIPEGREITETDKVTFEFPCEAAENGKCTVAALGSTTVKGLIELAQEHWEVHFPAGELPDARALIFERPLFDPEPCAVPTPMISSAQVA